MQKRQKEKINSLARKFYSMHGYQVDEGYDFSEAHHPQEVGAWNMALVAYDHIKGTTFSWIYQIDPREALRKKMNKL
jgi:hypothetical protein